MGNPKHLSERDPRSTLLQGSAAVWVKEFEYEVPSSIPIEVTVYTLCDLHDHLGPDRRKLEKCKWTGDDVSYWYF